MFASLEILVIQTTNTDYNKTNCFIFTVTVATLINEENGTPLTVADFNGDAPKHIKKVIVYDINGAYVYDFNAGSSTSIFLVNNQLAYNFEITYNNAGLDVKYKKEIDFTLIGDNNSRICVAPLQDFYEQIFTSIQEKKIVVFLPASNCYALAATLRNIYEQGQFNNVFTINKSYQAYTFDEDDTKTFLAWVNGGSSYSHNLDAIEFNKQEIEIIAGYDTLAFEMLLNSITGEYDTNILQIYYSSYYQNYVSTNTKIYVGDTLVYELTEDTNANEFVINWNWTAYNLTDENMLKIIVVGTKTDGTTKTLTEYFTIKGEEYLGTKDPTFIAIMVVLFFLFGITITSIGKTFGWIGIITCIASMAISVMALPGFFWLQMIQGGLFICFLYILLSGGGTQTIAGGVR